MRVIHNSTGSLSGGFLDVVLGLVGAGGAGSSKATDAFLAAQNQAAAEDLAAQRSRRWGLFGALAAATVGVVAIAYVMKK